jgi:hypothetical protein
MDTNDFVAAKTKLESTIAEHVASYPFLNKDFNYGERLMLEHAKRHLDVVIDKNDPVFFDTDPLDIGNTNIPRHQSDIVKDALLRTPKQEY